MKQTIMGFLLYKLITGIKVDDTEVTEPIRVYLDMIDSAQERDRLNSLRTHDDMANDIEYIVVNIDVVLG